MSFTESNTRDRLTGVATESALRRFVAAVLEGCGYGSPPVCFLQIDVDGLGETRGELGDGIADAVLLGVADCLNEGIRGHDLLGRSGDGFGICMPELTPAQARSAAQRLRLRLLSTPIATGRGAMQVTCSVGLALSDEPMSGADALLRRARDARTEAQCEGGDRVVSAG